MHIRESNTMRALFALIALLCLAVPATAQQEVPGKIISIRTGWNEDSYGIVINASQQNPARCDISTPGTGYVSRGDLPGYNTYYALALSAFFANRPVTITIHNTECVGPFPKLIGINVP
jgi:hypothetical protein